MRGQDSLRIGCYRKRESTSFAVVVSYCEGNFCCQELSCAGWLPPLSRAKVCVTNPTFKLLPPTNSQKPMPM